MKNGITIVKTKFFVNPEQKVVICELNCSMQIHKHPANYSIPMGWWDKQFPNINYCGDFTVKAKARCNDSDDFNEEIGKHIAESRAKYKMFRIAGRIWNICNSNLKRMANECSKSAKKCIYAQEEEKVHIQDLINKL